MRIGYTHGAFMSTLSNAFALWFQGPWYQKAYYVLQMVASIILLVMTEGAALIVRIALAVMQTAILVWDSIKLAEALNEERAAAA